jgi:hypothetical protein
MIAGDVAIFDRLTTANSIYVLSVQLSVYFDRYRNPELLQT